MKNRHIKHKVFNYIAIFDPASEGGFNVSFPALPGCVTFGRTYEEAKEKATEVLELWLEELAARKEKIPITRARPIIDEIQISIPVR